MQNLISFLRANKLVRVLFAALIVFSFLGLWAHHHEADHGHDCSVCYAVQSLIIQVAGLIFFVWIASLRPWRASRSEPTPIFSFFHGALLANRAPPTFA